MPHRLITIAISHYCEKARWALERAGIAYVESAHVPLAHLLYTKPAGGSSTPLLVTPTRTITESTDILRYADEQLDEAEKLFPSGAIADEVVALEDRFDAQLGPAARAWAYAHLLSGPTDTLHGLLTNRCSRAESLAFRALQGPIVTLMKKGMRIGPETEPWALARLEPLLDDVDARLADGRPYLCGDRFTAADLTFASLAAPIVDLSDVRSSPVADDALPRGFREGRRSFRARPSGEWVARLLRDDRPKTASRAAD